MSRERAPLKPIDDGLLPVSTWNPRANSDNRRFEYIDLSSVDQCNKVIASTTSIVPTEAPSRARQIVHKGDILVSTVRPNLNAVAEVPEHLHGATASTGFCVLRPDSRSLNGRYLFHWVRFRSFVDQMEGLANGANYPAVSDRIVKESEIPWPEISEQKRLAAILDKADAIRRKRQQAIDLTDQLIRSVFLDMFGDPVANPKGWDARPISHLTFRVTKGESPKWQGFEYVDTGVRFITSENVLWGQLDARRKCISESFHQKLARSALKEGDLLMNLVGASVGRACLVDRDALPANVNQAVSVVTLDNAKITPELALHQILTPQMQRKLLGNVVDAARANISLTNIRDLKLIIPPIALQMRFIKILESKKKILELMRGSREMRLFDSLARRAFAGDL